MSLLDYEGFEQHVGNAILFVELEYLVDGGLDRGHRLLLARKGGEIGVAPVA